MPRIAVPDIDLEDLDEDFETFEKFTPSRKDMVPVSGKYALQVRSECGVNRHRKAKREEWN